MKPAISWGCPTCTTPTILPETAQVTGLDGQFMGGVIGPMVGGAQVTLTVAAWANSTVEDFTFSYSIDGGTSYTDVLTVDDTTTIEQTVELPVETSGTLYLRVQDGDRSRGETILDTVSVDYIVIES